MCEYCTTDRDGYVSYLPRMGAGNAFINKGAMRVRGAYRTEFVIPIKFCPMCGRRLKEEHDER